MVRKQTGTVLITVVMMVALAALIATDIAYRQKLDIKRTAALLSRDQAFQYLLGAEEIAHLALFQDLKDDNNKKDPVIKDTLLETWADENEGFPVAGGYIQGKITDLQARFNVNSIFASDAQVQSEQRSRLTNLLGRLGIPSEENSQLSPSMLVERLVDWVDQDQAQTGFDGREDLDYLNAELPYRAANQIIWDISELMLIEGFTAQDIKELSPYVAFLPPDVPMNLNTADENVLATISGINVTELIRKRESTSESKEGGFEKVEDLFVEFYQAQAVSGNTSNTGDANDDDENQDPTPQPGGQVPIGNFSIYSEYFLLEATAVINQKPVHMEAILYRPTIEPGANNSTIRVKTITRKLVDPLKRV